MNFKTQPTGVHGPNDGFGLKNSKLQVPRGPKHHFHR